MQGGLAGLVLMGLVAVLARWLDPAAGFDAVFLAVGLFVITGVGALWVMGPMGYPRGSFGAPNFVTLFRLALLCTLGVGLTRPELLAVSGVAVFCIALLALSLDGIDGWLARRLDMASDFGARFDMEVDAGLACMLSLILLVGGRVGPEVLVLGFARYVFIAAGLVLPWLRVPLPDRFSRKVVCVMQIGVLCLLLLPGLAPWAGKGLTLCAVALLAWSFGRDVRYLAHHR
jgi:phosphatidylglycerophosphate synthase